MDEKIYGYARVSSVGQKEDRQLDALMNAGISKKDVYVDKMSGESFERPQYQKLLGKLRQNSVLVIKSIDRLGRNYEEIIEQWRIINKEKKADIVVLDMPLLDTRRDKNLLGTLISDMVLMLLSYVAENERVNIKQRQREGIEAARSRGIHLGRPQQPITEDFMEMYQLWEQGEITIREGAKRCNMSKTTFHRKVLKVNSEENTY